MTKEQRKKLKRKLLELHIKLYLPKLSESTPFDLENIKNASNNLLKLKGEKSC